MKELQVSIFICQIFAQYDIHDRTQQQAGANADYDQSNIALLLKTHPPNHPYRCIYSGRRQVKYIQTGSGG